MKTCLFDGCTRNSFSHGYCQVHGYKRTDSKAIESRNKTVEPRSVIRPYKRTTSDKPELKTTKKALMESWGYKNQKNMFFDIWNEREHKCQISGSNLDLVPESKFFWMFAHLIPKSLYPYFKLNKQNILLVDPDVHVCVDNFTEDMRIKYPKYDFDKWFSLVEKKKQEYVLFLKSNGI